MKIIYTLIAVLSISVVAAQEFDISAEVRPRYENKNGFKTLLKNGEDGTGFISQRTRLNFGFENKKMNIYLSLQNVRVWGDKSTLGAQDTAGKGIGTTLHEAWAEVNLSKTIALKLGRQEIIYDDHRIFGNVGWAQQARSHDAFLFRYRPSTTHKLDLGFAINADNQSGVHKIYSNKAGYKNFQYAWYHGSFDKLGVSFLFLNTAIDFKTVGGVSHEETNYMQTIGPRLTYKYNDLSLNAALYLQTGMKSSASVSGLYYAGGITYKISDVFKAGLGYEHLSGKDQNDKGKDFKSFAPLFGTNHKFNGWMDYFYVGNHGNSVGLNDISATLSYKKKKFSIKVIPHFFSAAADIYDSSNKKMDASLGTEIDITAGYKIAENISLNAGYSKMFATESMERLKGGDKDKGNYWTWMMFSFTPKLFHTSK